MKKLCGLACLFGLLLGAILIAPLPGEAVNYVTRPTLTLQIDPGGSGNTVPISVTLTDLDCTTISKNIIDVTGAPYTACFTLDTSKVYNNNPSNLSTITTRYFKIAAQDTTDAPKLPILLIADTSGSMDAIVLTNFKITPVTSSGGKLGSPYWGTFTNNEPNAGTLCSGVPCSPPDYGETHSLQIVLNHTMDFAGNPQSVCTNYSDVSTCTFVYQFSMRVAGYFDARPTGDSTSSAPTNGTASGDYVSLKGVGNFGTAGQINMFKPNTNNLTCHDPSSQSNPLDVDVCKLNIQLSYNTLNPTSYGTGTPNLWQNDQTTTPYPAYVCNRAPTGTQTTSNSCTPQMTITLVGTINGPDAWLDPMQGGGGGCLQTNNAGGTLTPKGPPCFSNSKKNLSDQTTTYFNNQITQDQQLFQSVGAVTGQACTTGQCTCGSSDTCKGTILITASVTPAVDLTFPFLGKGLDISNFAIDTGGVPPNPPDPPCPNPEPLGTGCKAFNNIVTIYSDPWVFTADINSTSGLWPVADSTHEYDVDSIDCESLLNQPAIIDPTTGQVISPAVIVSTWTVDSGSLKTTATVTRLGVGDIVTCNFHIHKNSTSSS